MEPLGNDRFEATFVPRPRGPLEVTIGGWVDHFGTWRRDLQRRATRARTSRVDLQIGAGLVRDAAQRAAARGRRGR